jgi:hypothetical protein
VFSSYSKTLGLKNNINDLYINPKSLQYLGYPVKVIEIGEGEEAARKTIEYMINIIKESSHNPFVRNTAEHIIKNCPPRDNLAEASAIYYFVRDNLKYRSDPIDLEYLSTPPLLLTKIKTGDAPSEDCDGHATLTSALLRSIGIPCKLRITSYVPDGDWSHVFTMALAGPKNNGLGVYQPKKWIAIDTIHDDKPFPFDTSSKATRIKDYTIE